LSDLKGKVVLIDFLKTSVLKTERVSKSIAWASINLKKHG
jgi:hypothetical protein